MIQMIQVIEKLHQVNSQADNNSQQQECGTPAVLECEPLSPRQYVLEQDGLFGFLFRVFVSNSR